MEEQIGHIDNSFAPAGYFITRYETVASRATIFRRLKEVPNFNKVAQGKKLFYHRECLENILGQAMAEQQTQAEQMQTFEL